MFEIQAHTIALCSLGNLTFLKCMKEHRLDISPVRCMHFLRVFKGQMINYNFGEKGKSEACNSSFSQSTQTRLA